MATKRALVVLCGLPAAGKTTLAKRLVDHWTSTGSFDAVHLEFDAVERQVRSDAAGAEEEEGSEDRWLKDWREARQRGIRDAEEAVRGGEDEVSKPKVVVVDDNMYYGSMRQQMRRIAESFRAGFVQVYVAISLEAALEANARRPVSEQVPGEVIHRMSEKMEPPGIEEGNVIHLTGQPALAVVAISLKESLPVDSPCEVITRVVQEAFKHPEEPFDDAADQARKKQTELSREEARRNAVHQTDQALCKQVSQYISSFPPTKRREASEKARGIKKNFTANLRERVNAILAVLHAENDLKPDATPEPNHVALVVEKLSNEFKDLFRLDEN